MENNENQKPQNPEPNQDPNLNTLPAVVETEEPKKKRTRRTSSLKNGKVEEDKLFLFVKRESLPATEIPRFLQLCDTYIISLGADTLSDTDVEEIALYYRDRIYADRIYETFASSNTTDANLIGQIDKLNKAIEQKKLNLGSRFIDKGKKRQDTSGESMMDLFAHFQDKKPDIEAMAAAKKSEVKENKAKNFTRTEDYMAEKMANSGPKAKKDEE